MIKTWFVVCLLRLVVPRHYVRKDKTLHAFWQTRKEGPLSRTLKCCPLNRVLYRSAALMAACLIYAGCAQVATTKPERLLKPRIAPDVPQRTAVALGRESQSGRPVEADETVSADQGQIQGNVAGPWSDSAKSAALRKTEVQDEEHQIKTAAYELAKSVGAIEKMKLCYVPKDDEWWATFYVDIGSIFDVKQFIWSRESEKFEPFLVLKRISKSKLASELKQDEPERKCTVLALPY